MIIVPDTSVIIDGRITELVKEKKKKYRVVVPEAVVAELENLANKGKESGYHGLEELNLLRKMSAEGLIELEYVGRRPRVSELKDIDNIIRDTATQVKGSLVTSDWIQARVAESKGIKVVYLTQKKVKKKPDIFKFFDPTTMSVHLRDNVVPMAKKGMPGEMKLVEISKDRMTEKKLKEMAREIIEYAKIDRDSFIEIEMEGATVVQLGQLRIAIARPPFSDGFEITAVRPIANIKLEDYKLSDKLLERLKVRAEGILVAGPPGAGKSTFSQALAEFYREQGKIVKTMESPRDLLVSDEITQYAPLEGDMEKTADILLLVRPDHTIYDELRKTHDFKIFADMRLAGVGMVGVVHATRAIDALQRLIGRVELGMIPQIVDTVVFVKDGRIEKIYKINFTVKVPSGMIEEDLARPVIEVRDFEMNEVEYEIYTFGEETVVMPAMEREEVPMSRLAGERIAQKLKKFMPTSRLEVEVKGSKAIVWVEDRYIPKLIGKKGKNIEKIEKIIGIGIDVRSLENKGFEDSRLEQEKEILQIGVEESKRHIHLIFGLEDAGKTVNVYANERHLLTATVGRKGEIKIDKNSDLGKNVLEAIEGGEDIYGTLA